MTLQLIGVLVASGVFAVGIFHIGKAFKEVLTRSRKEDNND